MDAGLIGLALGAGMLAAVNPCGFALLPAYLSLFVLDHQELPRQVAVARAARATLALTTGFAAVFLAFGLAVAPVAASVQGYLPAFTVMFGVVLAVAGLWVALGRRLPTIPVRRRRSARVEPPTASWASMTGFGASYAIASLGCTIAPFLAVVVTSFRSGSTAQGLVLFLVYAGGMGLVVGVAAVATALARGGLITPDAFSRRIPATDRRPGPVAGRCVRRLVRRLGSPGAARGRGHGSAGHRRRITPAVACRPRSRNRSRGLRHRPGCTGAHRPSASTPPRALIPGGRARTASSPTTRGEVMRMQAVFNDTVIADSADTVVVEGNHYFPPDSLRSEYLQAQPHPDAVPVEGAGLLLRRRGRRRGQSERRLVLPPSVVPGPPDQGARRLLERCPGSRRA